MIKTVIGVKKGFDANGSAIKVDTIELIAHTRESDSAEIVDYEGDFDGKLPFILRFAGAFDEYDDDAGKGTLFVLVNDNQVLYCSGIFTRAPLAANVLIGLPGQSDFSVSVHVWRE